ncbi:DUF4124 domain-containing protein [Dyella sp. GSA-30]|uniref:DUF4124 domain-containing protein n=1 Tax=Dyella sp. GSA-30 TaxID=2994496 RepID=UPI00248FDEC2|nr:DUF4124 domain-containing protein [Dyella sp. GSA-30]BDU20343.1 hypothetical protein DYGSA30_18000 [Dyella sp. GSA-30]
MRRPFLAAALLLLAPQVFAQAYKWTDSAGTVHYSETPPPTGTKYQRMTTTGSSEPLAQPASTAAKPATAATAAAQPVADTPANRAKFCSTLKTNLDMLKGDGPLVIQQDGQQKTVDEDQRKSQMNIAQSQYQQYCSGK